MAFDPRCVAFEGRLHADRRTAEYVGRASHDSDAACFRSQYAANKRATSRVFYFETRIVATSAEKTDKSIPPRINTATLSQVEERDDAASSPQDRQRQLELEAMDMEDVALPALREHSGGIPVPFNFSLTSTTAHQMQARLDRRRLRRTSEKTRFKHKVAVGFLVDAPEFPKKSGTILSTGATGMSGFQEARRTVKHLMQQVLPFANTDDLSEASGDGEHETAREKTLPTILHRDLGEYDNAVAYVGKTGFVVSHGREFLRCERYGAGDVVGCGVLLDTNTFFFTLNGNLMGMLAARTVYDLDAFEAEEVMEKSEEEDLDSEDDDENGKDDFDGGIGLLLDQINDVDMEDIHDSAEDRKVLYPAVSLHGVGELVHGVFDSHEFLFDLSGFELQIQRERQHALVAEGLKRSKNSSLSAVEHDMCKDDDTMVKLVHDFFVHYGYENAFEAFEAVLMPLKGPQSPSGQDDSDKNESNSKQDDSDDVELSCANHVKVVEDESKQGKMESNDSRIASRTQQIRESLSLRHEVRDHIRCYRTAQALVVLEHNVPSLLKNWSGYQARQLRKLTLYCRILCIIDVLTQESKTQNGHVSTNGASLLEREGEKRNGWNPELAIEFARQIFVSTVESTNGKRKRESKDLTFNKCESTNDIACVMSLLLYDQRESVPMTSRARKFLTPDFRESVAERLNSLLLGSDDLMTVAPRVSRLETFLNDLETLQKECLHHGCCVYPESVESVTTGNSTTMSHHRQESVYSSSDDSSLSQSGEEGRLDDDRE